MLLKSVNMSNRNVVLYIIIERSYFFCYYLLLSLFVYSYSDPENNELKYCSLDSTTT